MFTYTFSCMIFFVQLFSVVCSPKSRKKSWFVLFVGMHSAVLEAGSIQKPSFEI